MTGVAVATGKATATIAGKALHGASGCVSRETAATSVVVTKDVVDPVGMVVAGTDGYNIVAAGFTESTSATIEPSFGNNGILTIPPSSPGNTSVP